MTRIRPPRKIGGGEGVRAWPLRKKTFIEALKNIVKNIVATLLEGVHWGWGDVKALVSGPLKKRPKKIPKNIVATKLKALVSGPLKNTVYAASLSAFFFFKGESVHRNEVLIK